MMQATRIALFLGAGASNPLGLPVMDGMVDDSWRKTNVPDGNESAIYDAAANWAAAESEKNIIDFELLYTAIDTIAGVETADLSALPFTPHRGDRGFVFDRGSGYLQMDVAGARNSAKRLQERLKERVHELFGGVEPQEAVELHQPLFEEVLGFQQGRAELKVFTTNYDGAVEAPFWDDLYSDSNWNYELVNGFKDSPAGPPRFDPKEYSRKPSDDRLLLKLYKLHGSLNWIRRGDQVLLGAADDYTENNALIYPVRAHKQVSPFNVLLEEFEAALRKDVAILLAIGSSFRDDHLRSTVIQALKDGWLQKLVLVGPEAKEVVSKFRTEGVRQGEIIPIVEEFGDQVCLEEIHDALIQAGKTLEN